MISGPLSMRPVRLSMDTIATMTSMSLQYGVPLKALVDKFSHSRFEPSGFTNNREIPIAKSITDYVFRYLGGRFMEAEGDGDLTDQADEAPAAPVLAPVRVAPVTSRGVVAGGAGKSKTAPAARVASSFVNQADAPSCMDCGSIMIRNGACYKCPNCGSTRYSPATMPIAIACDAHGRLVHMPATMPVMWYTHVDVRNTA